MKTTVRVSLNGVVFNLDENAYQRLKSYLDELGQHFGNNSEVIDDIEGRFADLLSMRVKSADQAVNASSVNEIIDIIGSPKDIDNDGNISAEEVRRHFQNTNTQVRSRLYRDTDNKIIGGVCSGLGHYLKLDATWIRLVFVIFALLSLNVFSWRFPYINYFFTNIFSSRIPLVMLVYAIFWIVIPSAKTTRQTLEMHGYEPNPQISENKAVKSENGFWAFVKGFFRVLIKVCIIFTLSVIIITCGAFLIAGIVSFFGGTLFGGGENLISLLDYINIGTGSIFFQKLALALFIFIPLCLLIYYSIKTLARFKCKDKPMFVVCCVVWFLSLLYISGHIAVTFSDKTTYSREKFELNANSKILNITMNEDFEQPNFSGINWHNNLIYRKLDDKNSIYIRPQVNVRYVDSVADCRIEISKSAYSRNQKQAKDIVRKMPNGYTQIDSATIELQPMRFDKYNKWSFETIKIYLYVTDSIKVNFDGPIHYFRAR